MRRGEIDGLNDLVEFSKKLENAVLNTIERDKVMTQDIAKLSEPPVSKYVTSDEFIATVKKNLEKSLAA